MDNFDYNFVMSNLRFLFEDESEKPKRNLLECNSIYTSAKIQSGTSSTRSPTYSGSVSPMEQTSKFVNVLLEEALNSNPKLLDFLSENPRLGDEQRLPKIPVSQEEKPIRHRKPSLTPSSASHLDKENAQTGENFCKFCFKNREPASVYKSHKMKNRTGALLCPVLRKHVCELCGKTGDQAHTRKYCDLNDRQEPRRPPLRRLSNGIIVSFHNHK
ncbi:unnamed protein product [Phyllotreta striolata]|uniref:Nanos-type domain-containing protein n=1 Tax=Phyllotreta striolata TaxID=444603 RepID=A0A9N9TK81_PHYSR|nr:unnamed protein product [Phyllotreta striolata]